MKKMLLFTMALLTLNSVSADLILHESFDRQIGKLNVGNYSSSANNNDWYNQTGSSKFPTVVAGSLSYEGYAVENGNKVELLTGGAKDLRTFSSITSGKVYLSAIVNVDSLRTPRTGGAMATPVYYDYFLSLGDATGGTQAMFARLYARSVQDAEGNLIGFQLGVAKNNEISTPTTTVIPFTETFNVKTNYLVVLEYEFVDGEKNDVARLYVNPTKETTTATLVCGLDVKTAKGSAIGANTKDDATEIKSVHLRPGTNTPGRVYVDEIKVATAWEDLFTTEGGETPVEEPEITATPAVLQFGAQVFVGSRYTTKFVVKGKDLKGDITLSNKNSELTLDKTTIAKADAESENGVEVTATLVPVKSSTEGYITWRDTVSLVSEGATTAIVTTSWWTNSFVRCATIAELNSLAAAASGYENVYIKYTGEAVVTYKYNQSGDKLYLQDATAGVFINDSYWGNEIKQGDKVTNCMLYVDPTTSVGGMKYIGTQLGIEVLSHDNEITPQVVTLAELKTNAANYLNKLVKVENVTLDQRSATFKGVDADGDAIPDKITQNGSEATLSIVDGNPLVGTTKPKKADIIGISTNKLGNAIRPRGLADVISKDSPTAIENIALDMLNGNYEIYTVSGMRVEALQPGVNIIRQGDKTYKVVR